LFHFAHPLNPGEEQPTATRRDLDVAEKGWRPEHVRREVGKHGFSSVSHDYIGRYVFEFWVVYSLMSPELPDVTR